jgi:hypothetical protein
MTTETCTATRASAFRAGGVGSVSVSTSGRWGWVLALVCGLPRRGAIDCSLTIDGDRWVRRFGDRRRTTRIAVCQATTVERIGPVRLGFAVDAIGDGVILMQLRRVGLGRIELAATWLGIDVAHTDLGETIATWVSVRAGRPRPDGHWHAGVRYQSVLAPTPGHTATIVARPPRTTGASR